MYEKELQTVLNLIQEAAKIILGGFFNGFELEYKEDESPVTSIDKKVDVFLRTNLKEAFPEYGLLTEESQDDLSRLDKEYVWIIDPIDGTEEFVKRKYEFVVNVALIRNHQVVLGVIIEPQSGEIYYAVKGEGSYKLINNKKERIHVSNKLDNLYALTSPFHQSELERNYMEKHRDKIASIEYSGAAYKACLIASGKKDVCYRFSSKCKEWDVAAPKIIVEEAGGYYVDGNKKEITFNNEDVRLNNGYLIVNKLENIF